MKRAILVVILLAFAAWALLGPTDEPATPTTAQAPATATTASTSTPEPTTIPTKATVTPGQVMDADTSPVPKPSGPRPTITPEPLPSQAPTTVPMVTITPNPTPTQLPALPALDDPQTVALAFAQRYFTLDTSVDNSPAAGRARAAAVATPRLAAQLVQAPVNGRSGGDWLALLEHQGWTEAQPTVVTLGSAPDDTGTTVVRAVRVDLRSRGTDSWFDRRTPLITVELDRVDQEWRVDAYQVLEG
ncbi:hypothetical protein [Luteococcus sp.]|uniref:hypothetical protein n=1 Tax=Luteococcus sp. TaxID=1969402 RepID=UPI003734F74A